jgi:hypothetical protein
MAPRTTPAKKPRFCSDCGTQLVADASFCQDCGSPVGGRAAGVPTTSGVSGGWRWAVPGLAIGALVVLSVIRLASRGSGTEAGDQVPLGARPVSAPDISSMSPADRADRLFNRVMRLSSDGKADSAAFFGPMAMSAFEALAPLNAHQRYDLGLVALVTGAVPVATAQADTILTERATHLLGLVLAARAADARGDAAAAKGFRAKLLAAESRERAVALPEYTDHAADLRAAVDSARKR